MKAFKGMQFAVLAAVTLCAPLAMSVEDPARDDDAPATEEVGPCQLVQNEDGQELFIDAEGHEHGLGFKGHRAGEELGTLRWLPVIRRSFPASYHLADLGLIPKDIRNQRSCGSCYAHGAIGATESAMIKAGQADTSIDLSEQQDVSCNPANYGCGGGFSDEAKYIVEKGVTSEAAYPYTATGSRCKNPLPAPVAKPARWGYCGPSNRAPTLDEAKQCMLDFGMLSAEVAAGGSFSPDSAGYIKSCGSRSINHIVGMSGWDEEDYLDLRNSWGGSWGKGGFAKTKLGCNRFGGLGNSLTFVVFDGGPGPQVPHVQLPGIVQVRAGSEIPIGVRPERGVTYAWFQDGTKLADTSSMIYITPTKDTVYKLTATTPAGTAESVVSIKVTTEFH